MGGAEQLPQSHFSLSKDKNRATLASPGRTEVRCKDEPSRTRWILTGKGGDTVSGGRGLLLGGKCERSSQRPTPLPALQFLCIDSGDTGGSQGCARRLPEGLRGLTTAAGPDWAGEGASVSAVPVAAWREGFGLGHWLSLRTVMTPGGLARSRMEGATVRCGEDLGVSWLPCPCDRGRCPREPTASPTLRAN